MKIFSHPTIDNKNIRKTLNKRYLKQIKYIKVELKKGKEEKVKKYISFKYTQEIERARMENLYILKEGKKQYKK